MNFRQIRLKVVHIDEANECLENALNLLYHLEDLNSYRINSLNDAIEILRRIELRRDYE
jgi:hypothetical protein